ncbi:hypothetical protein PHISCL_07633 [Aspergillus sclerotialis]|uniref:Hemerythrin-like domain-containing protein n=1 Tax=Aspergillus sclerotialis TaxID=2070753 RepID=A0A3A2ZA85_9EURO|nr:hypothetical protein PHISCL_07633 [Aspergillus sclerotialis]
MKSTITDAIKEDHRTVEACYLYVIDESKRHQRARFKNLFIWELSRNLVSKELVVYPALEKKVQGGTFLANKDREENHATKEDLKAFQNLSPSDPKFIPAINDLMAHLRTHYVDEEMNQLPQLEEALSKKDSDHLAKLLRWSKVFLPTRAHPAAPSKPPMETAVGLVTAPFDQVADLFRKWPHHG